MNYPSSQHHSLRGQSGRGSLAPFSSSGTSSLLSSASHGAEYLLHHPYYMKRGGGGSDATGVDLSSHHLLTSKSSLDSASRSHHLASLYASASSPSAYALLAAGRDPAAGARAGSGSGHGASSSATSRPHSPHSPSLSSAEVDMTCLSFTETESLF
jgi:hypothetical protein